MTCKKATARKLVKCFLCDHTLRFRLSKLFQFTFVVKIPFSYSQLHEFDSSKSHDQLPQFPRVFLENEDPIEFLLFRTEQKIIIKHFDIFFF